MAPLHHWVALGSVVSWKNPRFQSNAQLCLMTDFDAILLRTFVQSSAWLVLATIFDASGQMAESCACPFPLALF